MKAILTYTTMIENKPVEHTKLFDTDKAKKICDVNNTFGNAVQEIYITDKGVIFYYGINDRELKIADQKIAKEWIGKNEPEKYIKFFGEVEEG